MFTLQEYHSLTLEQRLARLDCAHPPVVGITVPAPKSPLPAPRAAAKPRPQQPNRCPLPAPHAAAKPRPQQPSKRQTIPYQDLCAVLRQWRNISEVNKLLKQFRNTASMKKLRTERAWQHAALRVHLRQAGFKNPPWWTGCRPRSFTALQRRNKTRWTRRFVAALLK